MISLQAPFFFYAGTLAVAGLVGLFLLQPKTLEVPDGPASEPVPFRLVARDPRFIAACLANLAQAITAESVRAVDLT